MKQRHWIALLKIICLLAALPTFSGCSFFVLGFVRNLSDRPVFVKLIRKSFHGRYPQEPVNFLLYSPTLLAPKWSSTKQLHDSLPVVSTAAAISFRLPPHAIVEVSAGVNYFQPFKELCLQWADSSVQVLDSTQLAQAIHVKTLGGARIWYDIQ